MAIELKNQLESDLALVLPTRELMQVPTVDKLTDALIRLLGGSSAAKVADEDTASIASRLMGEVQKRLVPLVPGGDGAPLFCRHPQVGRSAYTGHWPRRCPDNSHAPSPPGS